MDRRARRGGYMPDAGCRIPRGVRNMLDASGGFISSDSGSRQASGNRKGFTLIELILATAISALVIGILSVCFSFTLRVWQGTQNQKPDQTFQLADLLNRQLAECDPKPIKFTGGVQHSVCRATELDCFCNRSFRKGDLTGRAGSRSLHV